MRFLLISLTESGRFKGDNTLGVYKGKMRKIIIEVQKTLRLHIASEEAFPDPDEFIDTINNVYSRTLKDAVRRKSK